MHRTLLAALSLSLLFAACSRESAGTYMTQADKLVKEKKYDEAVKMYRTVITEHATSEEAPAAYYAIASIQLNMQKNPNAALTTLTQLVAEHPKSAWAHKAQFTIGFTLANELQQYDKAKAAYEKYLATWPDSSFAPAVRLELQNLGKSPEQILKELQDSTGQSPTAPATTPAAVPSTVSAPQAAKK